MQAIAYIVVIGQEAPRTGGTWAYVIAAVLAFAAAAATAVAFWLIRWPLVRSYLVMWSRYDRGGNLNELPDLSELRLYGNILKRYPVAAGTEGEENLAVYAKRVWKIQDWR